MKLYSFCLRFSNLRKCSRPDISPATMVTPSGATAQDSNSLSPMKLVRTVPERRSQSLRLQSRETEMANCPPANTARSNNLSLYSSEGESALNFESKREDCAKKISDRFINLYLPVLNFQLAHF
jgi:hypothetical protein